MTSIPALPIPSTELVTKFQEAVCQSISSKPTEELDVKDKILILGTGSNDIVSAGWEIIHQELLSLIATNIQFSKILQRFAILVGSCAHGRAPPGEYADCAYRRNVVLDNIVQEELAVKSNQHGNVPFVAITYTDIPKEEDYRFHPSTVDLHVSNYIDTPYGVLPSDLDINNSEYVTKIPNVACVMASVPGDNGESLEQDSEPTRYQGIKSLPEMAISIGGWLRASALSCDRELGTNYTIPLPTRADDIVSMVKVPHKPGVVMVRPSGGFIEGILVPNPDLLKRYRPEGVSVDLWEQLVAIGPDDLDQTNINSYAESVVSALENVVLEKIVQRLNKVS